MDRALRSLCQSLLVVLVSQYRGIQEVCTPREASASCALSVADPRPVVLAHNSVYGRHGCVFLLFFSYVFVFFMFTCTFLSEPRDDNPPEHAAEMRGYGFWAARAPPNLLFGIQFFPSAGYGHEPHDARGEADDGGRGRVGTRRRDREDSSRERLEAPAVLSSSRSGYTLS